MIITHIPSLKMNVTILVLLLLAQFSRTFAHGVEIQSNICGCDRLALSKFHNDKLFYINGIQVGKDLFCKALLFNYANDCFPEIRLECSYSELNLSLDSLLVKQGRKLLQEVTKQPESQGFNQHVPPEKKKDDSKTLSPQHKIGIFASGIVALGCVLLCPCFYRKRKATTHSVLVKDINSTDSISSFDVNSAPEKVPPSPLRVPPSPLRVPPSPSRFSQSPKLTRLGSVHLNISQVKKATQRFSPTCQIGEGGFGTVYKAVLEDGQIVAIKRAKKEVFDSLRTEFSSEVELLSKIDHRNLVKLLGYVDQGNERLIITEYVPNGTLRDHLDGQRGRILDFNQRLEISIDIAHALTYLHLYAEKQIIHRDVKSSNILLTDSMRAKVADFGFARLGPVDSDATHISTKVKGTVGYLDPEYMKTYQLTPKSDVYSFGILLLEIITGRRPVDMKRPPAERVTLRWAFRKYNEGIVSDAVDPLMEEVVDSDVISKMFALAIQCAAPIRSDRPDMKLVGEQLWEIRADYLKSLKGKFFTKGN